MSEIRDMLNRTFNGAYGSYSDYLRRVVHLVTYYSEDDLTEAERTALNQLSSVLHKYAELWELKSAIRFAVEDEPDAISSFTEVGHMIVQVDNLVDFSTLISYVKRKAVKAGDWPIKDD